MTRSAAGMRGFWDDRARENAMWYVDTSLDYNDPDIETFFATGERVVSGALDDAPVVPRERHVAVEIGPGLGRVARALASRFDLVIGIDISAEMVARARELVPDERITFIVGNGIDLQPIESDSVDFVITFTVLQHLTSRELVDGYLQESARILKPGGILCAQWNNLPFPILWKLRVAWWRLRRRLGGPFAIEVRGAPEFAGTRVSFDHVRGVLEGCGLTIRATKDLRTLFAWIWAEKE